MKLPGLFLGIAFALMVTFAVVPGGNSSSTSAETPTPYPTLAPGAVVDTVALDLDPTGNTATSIGGGGSGIDPGDIQSARTNVPVNAEVSVDVVVDAVPDPGLYGVFFDLLFDPLVMSVVRVNTIDSPPEDVNVLQFSSPPAHSGIMGSSVQGGRLHVEASGGPPSETGPGRVANIVLRCISAGSSNLQLVSEFGGPPDTVTIIPAFPYSFTGQFPVLNELEASVSCGPGVDPEPTPAPIPVPVLVTEPSDHVDEVAIDLIGTGNTAVSIGVGGPGIDEGDIQASSEHIPIGAQVQFDVVVDQIPANGVFAVGFDLIYDPAIVSVTRSKSVTAPPEAVNVLQYAAEGSFSLLNFADAVPDSDGEFRIDSAVTVPFATGPGRVAQITVKCVADGITRLQLHDELNNVGDTIGLVWNPEGTALSELYGIKRQTGAVLGCGDHGQLPGVPVSARSVDGVDVEFSNVSALGQTQITRLPVRPFVSGYQVISSAYEVSTTNVYSGEVEVCINASLDPDDQERVVVLHGVGPDQWVEAETRYRESPQSMCGKTTSLSPFVLAYPVGVGGDVVLTSSPPASSHSAVLRMVGVAFATLLAVSSLALLLRRRT